jgi:two-component system OmpR family response regulator
VGGGANVGRVRVLVVDDEPSMSMAIGYLLRTAGHQVELVGDGPTAIAVSSTSPVQVVVLDLMLPHIPGDRVCQQLRAEHPDLAIVMISARSASQVRDRCLAAGADVFLPKPFTAGQLNEAISTARASTATLPAPRRAADHADTSPAPGGSADPGGKPASARQ